jgi:hypothetical protein
VPRSGAALIQEWRNSAPNWLTYDEHDVTTRYLNLPLTRTMLQALDPIPAPMPHESATAALKTVRFQAVRSTTPPLCDG